MQEEVLHMLDTDSTICFEVDCMTEPCELHTLEHQTDHLLPACEPRMSQSEVHCIDETVIEDSLLRRQAIVEE